MTTNNKNNNLKKLKLIELINRDMNKAEKIISDTHRVMNEILPAFDYNELEKMRAYTKLELDFFLEKWLHLQIALKVQDTEKVNKK